jgi:hypothetical protein
MNIFGIRYRRGLLGKLILQVQVREMRMLGPSVEPVLVWRDARVQDLPHLEVTS